MFNFLRKRPSFGRMAVRDRYQDISHWIKSESPLIVDGGANNGNTTALLLKQYPYAGIHAFEPIPELAATVAARYSSNKKITVHCNALGSISKTITFNVVNNLVSSSILRPTSINKGYHGSNMDIKEVLEVQQVRLDEVLDREIDLLKLDLQGYELEALLGAEGLLGRTKIIATEIEFVPLYQEQALFGDIDVYLRSKGFKLLNLYDLYTHQDGQLTAGDAVYLNTRYY